MKKTLADLDENELRYGLDFVLGINLQSASNSANFVEMLYRYKDQWPAAIDAEIQAYVDAQNVTTEKFNKLFNLKTPLANSQAN